MAAPGLSQDRTFHLLDWTPMANPFYENSKLAVALVDTLYVFSKKSQKA